MFLWFSCPDEIRSWSPPSHCLHCRCGFFYCNLHSLQMQQYDNVVTLIHHSHHCEVMWLLLSIIIVTYLVVLSTAINFTLCLKLTYTWKLKLQCKAMCIPCHCLWHGISLIIVSCVACMQIRGRKPMGMQKCSTVLHNTEMHNMPKSWQLASLIYCRQLWEKIDDKELE